MVYDYRYDKCEPRPAGDPSRDTCLIGPCDPLPGYDDCAGGQTCDYPIPNVVTVYFVGLSGDFLALCGNGTFHQLAWGKACNWSSVPYPWEGYPRIGLWWNPAMQKWRLGIYCAKPAPGCYAMFEQVANDPCIPGGIYTLTDELECGGCDDPDTCVDSEGAVAYVW